MIQTTDLRRLERVSAYTRPVFDVDDRDRPNQLGSCVLLRVLDCRFLLTAAHVLNESDRSTLYLGARDGNLVPICGRKYSPSIVGRKDRFDIAFLELAEDVSADSLSIEGTDVADNPNGNIYSVAGYPNSRSRLDSARKLIAADPIIITSTPSPIRPYDSLGVKPQTHIILDFSRTRMIETGRVLTAPFPAGMSGGGVWRSYDRSNPSSYLKKECLVGIFIEYHARDLNVLVGTRITAVLEMIRTGYPFLSESIPRSPYVRINWQ